MQKAVISFILLFIANLAASQQTSLRTYIDLSYFNTNPIPEKYDREFDYFQFHVPSLALQMELERSFFFQVQAGVQVRTNKEERSSYERQSGQLRFEFGRHVRTFKDEKYTFNFSTGFTAFSQIEEIERSRWNRRFLQRNIDQGVILSAIAGLEYNISKRFVFDVNFDVLGISILYKSELNNRQNAGIFESQVTSINASLRGNNRLRVGVGYLFN